MALEFAKMMNRVDRRIGNPSAGTLPVREAPAGNRRSPIEMMVSEVALMWILHKRVLSCTTRTEPLHRLIAEFSPIAFEAIRSDSPHIKSEHLWMVYFKGLIISGTHPREIMVQAINAVRIQHATKRNASVVSPTAKNVPDLVGTLKPTDTAEHIDSDILQHITTALGKGAPDVHDGGNGS